MLRMGSISSLSIWAKASTIMYRLEVCHLMAWTTSSATLRCRLVGAINSGASHVCHYYRPRSCQVGPPVHGVDAQGRTIVKRRIRRRDLLPSLKNFRLALVGMEACSSAHHWARGIELRWGTMYV